MLNYVKKFFELFSLALFALIFSFALIPNSNINVFNNFDVHARQVSHYRRHVHHCHRIKHRHHSHIHVHHYRHHHIDSLSKQLYKFVHGDAKAALEDPNSNKGIYPQPHQNDKYHKVIKVAKSKLGDKYVYGATGPNKFDCSGFTQYIYRHGAKINLPRTAQAQYQSESHRRSAKRGELVFFGHSRNRITHVGICLNHIKMIDAQDNGVKIENIHAPWWHLQGFAHV